MRRRKAKTITSRVSSVTNGFVQAILPNEIPDSEDVQRVLQILEIDPDRLRCTYCGDSVQHWDHLHPFVRNKKPTGYLNEARNIVPSCGPCNTSKSGRHWRDWMSGSARGSPASRGVPDLEERIQRITRLEAAVDLKPIELAELVDPALWSSYWARRDEIESLMFEAQKEAEQIRSQIGEAIGARAASHHS